MHPIKNEIADDIDMGDIAAAPGGDRSLKRLKMEASPERSAGTVDIPLPPTSSVRSDAFIVTTRDKNGQMVGRTNGKLDRQLTKSEYENTCRHYRAPNGDYHPTPIAHSRISVPEHLRGDPGAAKAHKRQAWEMMNAELGITSLRTYFEKDKKFHQANGHIKPEDTVVQTKNGPRKFMTRYEHGFQAGSESADILNVTGKGDVIFDNRSPGDVHAGKGIEEYRAGIKAIYGEDTETFLKSASGIYHKIENLEAYEPGSADRRYREYAGEYIKQNRELSTITVNLGGGIDANGQRQPDFHVGLDALKRSPAAAAQAWVKDLEMGKHWDKVQMLSPDGNTYKTLNRMANSADKQYFRAEMQKAGLPESMGEQTYGRSVKYQRFADNPPVLAKVGHAMKDIKDLSPAERNDIQTQHVMVANRNEAGQRTGTYTNLAEYERQKRELPHDVASDLGIPSDVYSQTFVKPERIERAVYDVRVAGQAGHGL